jgi:hypothetical protein
MAKKEEEKDPVDQLIDLFVYAPVGLLYEYQEVFPKLVRRGKSQVQIAKVIGQLALNRNRSEAVGTIAGGVASAVARQVTELGESIGLAPPSRTESEETSESDVMPPPPSPGDEVGPGPAAVPDADSAATGGADGGNEDESDPTAPEPPAAADEPKDAEALPLPIAGYDGLTAKEIIALLDEFDDGQLDRIRAHEEANRARKTVLGKLDRLAR